jgi:hypothetical protein
MNEMTESGEKAKGKGKGKDKDKSAKKAGKETENTVESQVGRMLVRAIWAQEWSAANPEGKTEQRKAAWKDARSGMIEKHLKTYRRAVGSLKRSGVMMSITPAAAAAAENDEDDGEDA